MAGQIRETGKQMATRRDCAATCGLEAELRQISRTRRTCSLALWKAEHIRLIEAKMARKPAWR
jgi:hypothetical protein